MAAANFEAALARVLAHEGGYVDHPLDPGGATKYGVTRATLAAWRGRPVSKAEVMALSRAEAGEIYRARYWKAVRGDELPTGLDYALFDIAVNSGPGRAARLIGAALGRPGLRAIDGEVAALCKARDAAALIRAVCAARRGFLQRLPTWPTFGRGWSRRVAEVERAALAMAGAPAGASVPSTTHSNTEETPMLDSKSILASRTVWANAVGFGALALSLLGFDASGVDAGKVTDAVLQTVAGASFVASTLFRVVATRKLVK
jgi:lysozyme family protein